MSYFSYFPSTPYSNDLTDLTKVKVVKDITIRAKISDYYKNTAITSLPYSIQDGERPETLSYRVYDRSDLYWIILLFNEIHDPTFEWPLSTAELESKLETKYKGYALYYPDTARTPDQFQVQQDILSLKGATTVTQVLADGTTISANIVKWDPTYNCIVIDGDQADMFDPASDSPLVSTDNFARICINGDTNKLLAFNKIMPYQYAVHHFEDSEGNVLDPRSGPPSDPTNPSSIMNRYVSDTAFVEVLAINNRTYEYNKNEDKRNIRVVKPEYMNSIITQFRGLFA